LENLYGDMDINRALDTIGEHIKISAKESPGYYELKHYKPRFDEGCSERLHQWEQTKLQWLQDPSQISMGII
jgi:hypothetical protein